MASCQVCGYELGHGRCLICRDYRTAAMATGGSGVPLWSGVEARALRVARRMSVRDFAKHLGISDRTVSKWESDSGRIVPRPVNQAALDTSLSRCDPETKARFRQLARDHAAAAVERLSTTEFADRESAWR